MEYKRLNRHEFLAQIPQIMRLHDRCFGAGTISKESFEWRYLQHPSQKLLAYAAVDNEKIVAFFGASPLTLTYEKLSWNACLSLNAMTDPSYGGRGLFVRLAHDLFEQMEQECYSAVIGFPNVESNRIHNTALQYHTVYEVPMLEMPITKTDNVDLCFDNTFSFDYSKAEQIRNRIAVKKDRSYLYWRYACSPENSYTNIVITTGEQVCAYAVCKKWRDRLNLVEFHAQTTDYADHLLQKCISYGTKINCAFITVWAPINTEIHHLFEKRKFLNHYPIHYFNVKVLGVQSKEIDFLDPRNWYLQMGDNNTY